MSKIEKAIQRLRSSPKDYTWQEFVAVMTSFGYTMEAGNGSRRKFRQNASKFPLSVHEPHPKGILKPYAVRQIVEYLEREGHIHE